MGLVTVSGRCRLSPSDIRRAPPGPLSHDRGIYVNFDIPKEIQDYLDALDAFIEAEIKPLEQENDNTRFFDKRREFARTDFEHDGTPRKDWEELLAEMRRRADKAGFLRYAVPKKYGGQDGTNLGMAIIREHLAAKGLGLHNDLQNESAVVGNFPTVRMWENYGSGEQKRKFLDGMFTGETRVAFGLIFARTSGAEGRAQGISWCERRPGSSIGAITWRSATRWRCATTRPTGWCATRPTRRCK